MKSQIIALSLAVALHGGWASAQSADDSIPASAEQVQPLAVGASVPVLTLQTADGKAVDLRKAIAKKPTVLIFYRGGWCPFCNIHLGQLQEAHPGLIDMGYQVLAISPDRPAKLGESVEKGDLVYTLLSDSSMAAAKAFGIAFRVDDGTLEKYKGYGIDLEETSGESHHLLPVPAVFIVGKDGVVRFAYANADYKIRLQPEALLAAAKGALGEIVKLPAPRQSGGMPLLDALKQRRSVRSFSEKAIAPQLLSNLLWAAFGVNRPESGMRTAPSSYNWQDVTLYVFTPDGVWTYEANAHRLLPVRQGDHRKLAGMQGYVWEAPLSLVYVSDFAKMQQGDEPFSDDYKLKIGGIDAGHISQNVYLFCASEGLGAVARASVDAKAFAEAFGLSPEQQVMFGQTIGWPSEE